jgi:hypothetical protein
VTANVDPKCFGISYKERRSAALAEWQIVASFAAIKDQTASGESGSRETDSIPPMV